MLHQANGGLARGTRLGPYEIASLIGVGGMGEVYLANDTRLDRRVAIKVLPPTFSDDPARRQRFEREARAISQFTHPHICVLYDVGEAKLSPGDERSAVHYLVMEHLTGETLAQRIARGVMTLHDVVGIGVEIAEALSQAHQHGIVHRDLKPGNVMLTDSGAKLLDFGLARHFISSGRLADSTASTFLPSAPLTVEGNVIGTLQYMAPEQLEGDETDARTDIWALGCLLYEMLTGQPPFRGSTQTGIIAAIASSDPTPVRTLRPDTPFLIDQLVARCLAKKPDDRWQSARDVAVALEWATEAADRDSIGVPTPDATRRRSRARVAALAAILIATSAIAFWSGRTWLARRSIGSPPAPIRRLTWDSGMEMMPAISPDGLSFVYVSGPPGNRDIFLRRVGGEASINLTPDSSVDDVQPAYSPDGQHIAFRSERDGGGIFIMGATGEAVRRITDFGFDPSWSPDGNSLTIAIESSIAAIHMGAGGIWIVDVRTGARRKVCDCDAMRPAFSPSGKRIAYLVKSAASRYAVSTIPAAGGNSVTLPVKAGRTMPGMWLTSGMAWSPTGLWFNAGTNIWSIDVDESTGEEREDARRWTSLTVIPGPPSVTRDGKRLVFAAMSRRFDLYRHDFNTRDGKVGIQDQPLLTTFRSVDINTYNSPDGRWLGGNFFKDGRLIPAFIRSDGTETRIPEMPQLRSTSTGWTTDSSEVIVCVVDGSRTSTLLVHIDGSGYDRFPMPALPDDLYFEPIMSRNGRWMTVLVGEAETPYLISFASGKQTAAPLPSMTGDGVFVPLGNGCSPDSRALLGFRRGASPRHVEPVLYRFEPDTARFDRIATLEGAYHEWSVSWFPDSRRILLFRSGRRELKVLDSVTHELRDVGVLPAGFSRAILSVDGKSLFTAMKAAEADVWMLELDQPPARSEN